MFGLPKIPGNAREVPVRTAIKYALYYLRLAKDVRDYTQIGNLRGFLRHHIPLRNKDVKILIPRRVYQNGAKLRA